MNAARVGQHDARIAHQFEEIEEADGIHEPQPGHRLGALLWHVLRGEEDEARSAVNDALIAWAMPDPQYSWHLAQAYAHLGDLDQAYEWIERAVNLQLINHPFLAQHDRLLDPLREDARFIALLDRVRADWETETATWSAAS